MSHWHGTRLECWLPAGGHVEHGETKAKAAREALEETGLDVQLVSGPVVSLPAGFPHSPVPVPWRLTEMPARTPISVIHQGDRHARPHGRPRGARRGLRYAACDTG